MIEFAYAVIIIGFLILGIRLFVKLREISSWRSEEPPDAADSSGSRRDLLELTLEEPGNDFDSPQDESDERSPQH